MRKKNIILLLFFLIYLGFVCAPVCVLESSLFSFENDLNVSKETFIQLEKIIEDCFPEDEVYAIKPLEKGNESLFLVDVGWDQFVIRMSSKWQSSLAFYRECYMTERMSELAIGPKLHHVVMDPQALILAYIPTDACRKWFYTLDNEEKKIVYTEVLRKLKVVHDSVRGQPFAFIENAFQKLQKLSYPYPSYLKEVVDWVQQVETLFSEKFSMSLCHNDFHFGNVLWVDKEEILLIDWETMDWGDPYFDVAKLGYNIEDGIEFIEAYLGRAPTPLERCHYHVSKSLLDVVIGVNQLLRFGGSVSGDIRVWCEKMDRDLEGCFPDLSSVEGSERSYWSALFVLSRLKENQDVRFGWVKYLEESL